MQPVCVTCLIAADGQKKYMVGNIATTVSTSVPNTNCMPGSNDNTDSVARAINLNYQCHNNV